MADETVEAGKPVLSVVVPMRNEADVLGIFLARLLPAMDAIGVGYEVVCVDDGSTDETWAKVREVESADPRIRGLRLSRNFGKELAMTAGLDAAKGDALVFIDADLQDPPELISDFYKLWQAGYQNVYGLRISRQEDSWAKRTSASLFYAVFNRLSSVPLPVNAGDFRLLGPEAVAALRRFKERHRFMKGLYAWIGFPSVAVPYERPCRAAGATKFNAARLFNFAVEGIASHSTTLLRLWTYVGILAVLLAALLGLWMIIEYFAFGRNPRGYYLNLFILLGFSSINFIMLGIIGEYVGRIYEEVKQRPLYILRSDDSEPTE
ncbi:glycosyltransferase family 2 protein [Methyloceanibacter sp. wino2]|uniref:glycosyltransferase family 2 protein n=1 Tax=Methyloceanibacter sp. wino2 TaxID=2170729 RepID=UPI000D3EB87E|nr:glycosyltransferase family 2 protein [Methyloceanibacter sp. wino2]